MDGKEGDTGGSSGTRPAPLHLRPPPTGLASFRSSPSDLRSTHPRYIDALNAAISRASISGEQGPKRRSPTATDSHREDVDRIRQSLNRLEDYRCSQAPTSCPPRSRKRVRDTEKFTSLFKCGRKHYTCMSCYEHHSMRCRYCCSTDGSVVQLERKRARIFTNKYSCHKGRGLVMPKENEFFCPDNSCQFCGPLDSVLDHVKGVHSVPIQCFSYGDVMRIPLHLVGKYLILRAEDGATFVLWGEDIESSKLLSVVCAEQFSSCGSKFIFDVTHDLSPEVLGARRGQHVVSDGKKVRPRNTVGSSIVMYGKNADVRRISGAKCRITQHRISNSNLGNMAIDSQLALLVVPKSRDGNWYGDVVLSISTV